MAVSLESHASSCSSDRSQRKVLLRGLGCHVVQGGTLPIVFDEVLDKFCNITRKSKPDLKSSLVELNARTDEVKTESKWAERLAAMIDCDAMDSSDATGSSCKFAVKCGVKPQSLRGLKAAKLPNTDLDVAVIREFKLGQQDIVEVPFTAVEK